MRHIQSPGWVGGFMFREMRSHDDERTRLHSHTTFFEDGYYTYKEKLTAFSSR